MRIKKTLLELRTKYRKLKPGKIHLRCPYCGRKMSNMERAEWDVPEAFLCEIGCDRCSMGCKEPTPYYFTEDGKEILYDWDYDVEQNKYIFDITGYRKTKD